MAGDVAVLWQSRNVFLSLYTWPFGALPGALEADLAGRTRAARQSCCFDMAGAASLPKQMWLSYCRRETRRRPRCRRTP